jgi:hypothetical protein
VISSARGTPAATGSKTLKLLPEEIIYDFLNPFGRVVLLMLLSTLFFPSFPAQFQTHSQSHTRLQINAAASSLYGRDKVVTLENIFLRFFFLFIAPRAFVSIN